MSPFSDGLKSIATMRQLPGRLGPSLLPELLTLFMKETPQRLSDLERFAAQRDGAALEALAHKIAGSCSTVAAKQMRLVALDLERTARARDLDRADAQVAALRKAAGRFEEAMKRKELIPS